MNIYLVIQITPLGDIEDKFFYYKRAANNRVKELENLHTDMYSFYVKTIEVSGSKK